MTALTRLDDTFSFSHRPLYDNSSSSTFASCKSFVSNPSETIPKWGQSLIMSLQPSVCFPSRWSRGYIHIIFCPRFGMPSLRGSRRCLLDAERYREQRGLEGGQPTHRYPLWGQVAQPVSPVRSYDVFPQVPRVTLGPRAGRSSASG